MQGILSPAMAQFSLFVCVRSENIGAAWVMGDHGNTLHVLLPFPFCIL